MREYRLTDRSRCSERSLMSSRYANLLHKKTHRRLAPTMLSAPKVVHILGRSSSHNRYRMPLPNSLTGLHAATVIEVPSLIDLFARTQPLVMPEALSKSHPIVVQGIFGWSQGAQRGVTALKRTGSGRLGNSLTQQVDQKTLAGFVLDQ